MLGVEDLTVRYGRVPAVRGVTLNVGEGEVVGLVGANGAGKTTTLYALAGCRPIAGGDILFKDKSIVGSPPERIARSGLALVPENRRIFGSLLVGENVRLGLGAGKGLAAASDEDEVLGKVLALFPILETRWDAPASTLSGGEQQQLAIARALVMQPDLLMLDEPSLGLAPRLVDLLFEILADIRAAGQTILLVEQNVQRTLRFADRTYVMRGGRISLHATRDEFSKMKNDEIEEAFFGSHKEPSPTAKVDAAE
jgi:branched-chain amino acid transport system ATP-binding protein